MPKPDLAGGPKPPERLDDDTFVFEVGRLSLTVDVDLTPGEETFTLVQAQVEGPNGNLRDLVAADHIEDHPIPPPLLDFLI
jgi:hypothetical protein